MAKMDIKVRIEMCLEDSCVRYVIVYTNGRIVQGHRVYCLASRVNIFSQGKVQRVNGRTVKEDYPGFGGHVVSIRPGLQGWLR